MKKLAVICISVVVIVLLCLGAFYYFNDTSGKTWPEHGDPLKVGYVPDEETAIKVAEAVWLPLYGKEIYDHKPFRAILKDSVWVVDGTLADGARGGVPHAEIGKMDCKVIRIYHTK